MIIILIMDKKLLKKAIKKAGSQAELARLLGCTRQNICNMMRGIPIGEQFKQKLIIYIES
jgi:DNA-binding XRE family transcriptional regulator